MSGYDPPHAYDHDDDEVDPFEVMSPQWDDKDLNWYDDEHDDDDSVNREQKRKQQEVDVKLHELNTCVVRDDPTKLKELMEYLRIHAPGTFDPFYGAKDPPLNLACRRGSIKCVKALLDMRIYFPLTLIYDCLRRLEVLRLVLQRLSERQQELDLRMSRSDAFYATKNHILVESREQIFLKAIRENTTAAVKLLMEHNFHISRWEINEEPKEVIAKIKEERESCRSASILIIAMRNYLKCPIDSVRKQDVNILKRVAQHVWSERLNYEVWYHEWPRCVKAKVDKIK